ncbi:hypothetical protein H351_29590 [Rhodococcus erythropolis R138]|nr:hypothetical protein H351_00015 [Rhodococcus erythropolis R138]ALU73271.1 hypothetical protein H351_29590 [Rhodococcus erythropolis R138]
MTAIHLLRDPFYRLMQILRRARQLMRHRHTKDVAGPSRVDRIIQTWPTSLPAADTMIDISLVAIHTRLHQKINLDPVFCRRCCISTPDLHTHVRRRDTQLETFR